MSLADYALIGNCQISALVRNSGAVEWCCMPRFDSPPVFGALLRAEDGGRFLIGPASGAAGVQKYLPNTNIVETRFDTEDGAFRVIDFAPRFPLYDRSFRPTKIVRIVEPLSGTPRVRVLCDPVLGWSGKRPASENHSHHVSYHYEGTELRLTTDAPIAYCRGDAFALTEKKHFVLAWGAPVEEALEPLCDRFFNETAKYWRNWVKNCEIPPLAQDQVIRSALALKLHCYEDTGAIVASMTTSIPESPRSGRTWDYRYCWLRDAYYVLGALRLLGRFEEREQFTHFLIHVASSSRDLNLAPLYRIDGRSDLDESIQGDWPGYLSDGPVRVGNAAALHRQNDVFGEMVLALAPLFLDARFREHANATLLDLVARLADKAVDVAGAPDAGIWEFRSEWKPQTFSALMCWAGADRMARIARAHRPERAEHYMQAASRIRSEIETRARDASRRCLVGEYDGKEVDAALLQAVTLRLLEKNDPYTRGTIDAIRRDLEQDGWLQRYRIDDGFGRPSVAFTLCTFWLIEALAAAGDLDAARSLMERTSRIRSPLGLLSEDVEPSTGEMQGNFPQAYSHVGLIHAAFASSPQWTEWL